MEQGGRQDAGGPQADYEYDMAHDVPPGETSSKAWRAHRPPTDGRVPQSDDSQDYSYDLAHDVPRADREPPR